MPWFDRPGAVTASVRQECSSVDRHGGYGRCRNRGCRAAAVGLYQALFSRADGQDCGLLFVEHGGWRHHRRSADCTCSRMVGSALDLGPGAVGNPGGAGIADLVAPTEPAGAGRGEPYRSAMARTARLVGKHLFRLAGWSVLRAGYLVGGALPRGWLQSAAEQCLLQWLHADWFTQRVHHALAGAALWPAALADGLLRRAGNGLSAGHCLASAGQSAARVHAAGHSPERDLFDVAGVADVRSQHAACG